jgi:hypothetical protein
VCKYFVAVDKARSIVSNAHCICFFSVALSVLSSTGNETKDVKSKITVVSERYVVNYFTLSKVLHFTPQILIRIKIH